MGDFCVIAGLLVSAFVFGGVIGWCIREENDPD